MYHALADDKVVKAWGKIKKDISSSELSRVLGRYGMEVWYVEPPACTGTCTKDKTDSGKVILVQYRKKGKDWLVDWKPWQNAPSPAKVTETLPSGQKFKVMHQPGYVESGGAASINIPTGYVDSADDEQEFMVRAYCRCNCEDDRLIDTLYIQYKKDGRTTATTGENGTGDKK